MVHKNSELDFYVSKAGISIRDYKTKTFINALEKLIKENNKTYDYVITKRSIQNLTKWSHQKKVINNLHLFSKKNQDQLPNSRKMIMDNFIFKKFFQSTIMSKNFSVSIFQTLF